jgi:hypothetical protein
MKKQAAALVMQGSTGRSLRPKPTEGRLTQQPPLTGARCII